MTEWGVILVISSIVSLGVLIGTPLMRLNASITRLDVTIKAVEKRADCDRADNEKEHLAIWDRCDEQDRTINNHETRITVLEKKDE
jgi:hypothetical protein